MNIRFLLDGPEKGMHVSEFWSRSQILEAIKILKLKPVSSLNKLKYYPRRLMTYKPTKKVNLRHELSCLTSNVNPIDFYHIHKSPKRSPNTHLMRMPTQPIHRKLTPVSSTRSLSPSKISRVSKLDTLIQQCSDLSLSSDLTLTRDKSPILKNSLSSQCISGRISLPKLNNI